LNAPSDGSDVIAGDSALQTFAAATEKARSPMVLCHDRGTCSDGDEADRRRLRDSISATRCSSLPWWRCCLGHSKNFSDDDDDGETEVDPLWDAQPVELTKKRRHVLAPPCRVHETGGRIYDGL